MEIRSIDWFRETRKGGVSEGITAIFQNGVVVDVLKHMDKYWAVAYKYGEEISSSSAISIAKLSNRGYIGKAKQKVWKFFPSWD